MQAFFAFIPLIITLVLVSPASSSQQARFDRMLFHQRFLWHLQLQSLDSMLMV
jgi:hypothetical protein